MVPDKAQHYWGSYCLSTISQKHIGTTAGALAGFTLGLLWEVKDSKTSLGTADGGVIGFSYKDLIADGLGVVSSLVNKDNRISLWMDYSTLDQNIMLMVAIKI